MTRPLLYLVPDLIGPPGGIAQYCRMVSRALVEAHKPLSVIALLDQANSSEKAPTLLGKIAYHPCHGSRPTFVRRAILQTARQRPGYILAGHINLAPLAWLLARATRVPLITFVYGVDAWQPLSQARRFTLQHSNLIVAISHFTARRATETNQLRSGQVVVLHNCLDPEQAIEAAPRQPSNHSLLTVGRMSLAEQYKGHDYVIRALPDLLAEFPDLTYDIVGEGDWRPSLEQLSREVGVATSVNFHGRVSAKRLAAFYASASLYVMPSRSEGFGFVFLEAMRQGLPVVAGNEDATPEVVAHGRTGLLVNPRATQELASAIATLLNDESHRVTMGEAARRHVEEHFAFPAFQHQLLSYLSTVGTLNS